MSNDNTVPGEPKKLSAKERAARHEELRRRSSQSAIFAECKNPDIAVRWVRKDDPNDISLHEWMGFQIAKEPDPKAERAKRRFNTSVSPREDGTYVLGDVILMEIQKDDYDFFVNEGIERSRQQVDGGKETFRHEAAKLDVPTFERDKAGQFRS